MITFIYYCSTCQQLSENTTGEELSTCPHCGQDAKRTATRETMNEYRLVTKTGEGFVYAGSYDLLDFPGENVAQFYRDGRICYTARDVVSVELVP